MKVAFNPDKRSWQPSVLPGQIVLVTTVDAQGEVDLAPKSWVTMAAFAGPIIAFGCNTAHTTYQNVLATGQFVLNIPSEPLVGRIWSLPDFHGPERVRQCGLTLQPAQKVLPPIIEECRAHLECELESIKHYDPEVLIFGKVVAASIDDACLGGGILDQYRALRPVFFLENGVYGSIDGAKRVGAPRPT